MPKSRRDKPVALTKTKSRKSRETKSRLIAEIHDCLGRYARVFVFSVQCMRNERWKQMRASVSGATADGGGATDAGALNGAACRFFYGRLKVMRHALTTWSPEQQQQQQQEEDTTEMATAKKLKKKSKKGAGKDGARPERVARGAARVARRLTGQCGLMFTDASAACVADWCGAISGAAEFARAGVRAPRTVTLSQQQLTEAVADGLLAPCLEPRLRTLGVPVRLARGQLQLQLPEDQLHHTVCTAGEQLRPEQCRLLQLLQLPLDTFSVQLRCVLTLGTAKFRQLSSEGAADASQNKLCETMQVDETDVAAPFTAGKVSHTVEE